MIRIYGFVAKPSTNVFRFFLSAGVCSASKTMPLVGPSMYHASGLTDSESFQILKIAGLTDVFFAIWSTWKSSMSGRCKFHVKVWTGLAAMPSLNATAL